MDIMLTLATQGARMPVGQKFGGYRWRVTEGGPDSPSVFDQLLPDPFCIVAGLNVTPHTATCVVEDTAGRAVGAMVTLDVRPDIGGGDPMGELYLAPTGISVAITL